MSSMLTAVRAQQSYHYVTTQRGGGGTEVVMVGDASATQGVQQITYRKGSQTGHVTVLVVANTAYVRGDAFTLANYMAFSPREAESHAGKWLSLAHDAPDFAPVAADVRFGRSTLDELKLTGSLRDIGNGVVHGRRVTGIRTQISRAGETASETLYIEVQGPPLPVEDVIVWKGQVVVDTVYSDWNEHVGVTPPQSSIAMR